MRQLTQIVPSGRIRLGEYPYTYVRSIVMRSQLIDKREYHKLVKMSEAEIIQYLSTTTYSEEINALSGTHSGIALVEKALLQNMVKAWKKLKRISPTPLVRVMDAYAFRYDIANIKTIMRALYCSTKDDISHLLVEMGTLTRDELAALAGKPRISDVLASVGLTSVHAIESALGDFEKTKNLAALENALDRYYFDTIALFARKMGRSGRFLTQFLLEEIKVRNIITLFSARRANIEPEKVVSQLLPTYDTRADALFASLAGESIEKILQKLKKTEWAGAIKRGEEEYKKDGSLAGIEIALQGELVQKTQVLEHHNPVSVNNILGFLLAKEIEARNIRFLVKAKEFGMPEEFIEKELVVS